MGVHGHGGAAHGHDRQNIFARPAPTARPRRSRVRCTRGWAQPHHKTGHTPKGHLRKPERRFWGSKQPDGSKPHQQFTSTCGGKQPTLPACEHFATEGGFQNAYVLPHHNPQRPFLATSPFAHKAHRHLTSLKGFARRKTNKVPHHLHAALGHNAAPTVCIANKALCPSPAPLPTNPTGISQPPCLRQCCAQLATPQRGTRLLANQPPLNFQSALLSQPPCASTGL